MRYSMLVDDGVVKILNVSQVIHSGPGHCIARLTSASWGDMSGARNKQQQRTQRALN